MNQNVLSWIDEEMSRLRDAGLLTAIRTIESQMDVLGDHR